MTSPFITTKDVTVIYAISFLEAIHFVRFLMHTKEEKCIEIQMKFAGVSCRIQGIINCHSLWIPTIRVALFLADNEDDIFVCTSNPFFKLAKKIKVHLIWTLTCKKKINEDHNIRQYMIFF